ncbi:MAG: c-type cytochrome [Halothiobacillaceae bacterium]|nr:c-type cytochrome [Halothiobacillaceae bacterium]HER34314.1 c-type cytochrome [Halothiobacillaceae bacterium]
MKKLTAIAFASGLTIASMQAMAADASAGKNLYEQSCASCHGMKAQGQGMFPKLAGQSAERITTALTHYKNGDQAALKEMEGNLGGSNYAIMAPNAAGLSEADIENLGAYISSL